MSRCIQRQKQPTPQHIVVEEKKLAKAQAAADGVKAESSQSGAKDHQIGDRKKPWKPQ